MMKTKLGMLKTVGAAVVLLTTATASAETYTYTSDTTRGNSAKPENWLASDGVSHPTYAPTDANTLGNADIYIVTNGVAMASPSVNAGSAVRFYGNLVIGEVGGTRGETMSECQRGQAATYDNVTFANGNYFDGGGRGIVFSGIFDGNVRVTAPESTPFTFGYRYGDATAARIVGYRAVFDVAEGCAYKYNDTHYVWLTWSGSLAKFLGTLDLSKSANLSVTFEDSVGTTNFKALKFCGGSSNVVNCISAPLKAKTLTIGDGALFRLAASTSDSTVSHASLKCETAELAGTVKLSLAVFDDPVVPQDTTLEIVLFEAANGGLTDGMFSVDLGGNEQKSTFKACAVNAAGTKLIARFEIPSSTQYHLQTSAHGNVAEASLWQRADGDQRAPTDPQNAEDQCEFVVRNGLWASDSSHHSVSRDLYGKSITFGQVGGSAGTYRFTSSYLESSYTYFHSPVYFANGVLLIRGYWGGTHTGALMKGSVIVTSPTNAPFAFECEFGEAANPWLVRFENSFSSEADCGFRATGAGAHLWEFRGDLSGYRGTMDFSGNPKVSASFENTIGTTDLAELKFGAGSTNTVNCLTAPLKAKTLTAGDGATFHLAATVSGTTVGCASLKCETAAFAGTVNLSLGAFVDPSSQEAIDVDLVLFEATDGGLSDAMFNVDLGPNAKKSSFKWCKVNDAGTKLIARFEIPADTRYHLQSGAYGNIATAASWLQIDGKTQRAPTDPQNADDGCAFIVRNGLWTSDSCYNNNVSRDIYGKSITFGDVGGTSGTYTFTACYLESSYTHFHAPAYFANGKLFIRGDWGGARTGALMRGSVVVTAPATAPFVFEVELGSVANPWLVRFENSFAGNEDCGIVTKKTTAANESAHNWEFLGDLSGYKGSIDFSPTPNVWPKFGSAVGTIDMKTLAFADGQKVTLVGRADGSSYRMPCLKARTFALGGELNVTLDLAERVPSAVGRLAVLQTSGAIDASKVKVQVQGVGARRFTGVAAETVSGETTVYALVPPKGLCLIIR